MFTGAAVLSGAAALDAPALTLRGDVGLGNDWPVVGDLGGLYIGMPSLEQVRRFDPEAFAAGTTSEIDAAGTGASALFSGALSEDGFGTAFSRREDDAATMTLVVGAPLSSGGPDTTDAGAVYVYTGLDAHPAGDFLAANADGVVAADAAYAHFGSTVAACGDLDGDGLGDWMAAAEWGAGGGDLSGDVYVALSGRGDTVGVHAWSDLVHLAGPSEAAAYGRALWCTDSLDGDDAAELVIGAPGAFDAEGRLQPGRVDVWSGAALAAAVAGGGAPGRPDLSLYGAYTGDSFGSSLAVGDLTGDGRADLVIGAPGANSQGTDNDVAGAVYVYPSRLVPDAVGLAGRYEPDYRGTLLGEDPRGTLGATVLTADLDADGLVDLCVGAPGTNTAGVDESVQAGTVYVYAGGEAGWTGDLPLSAAAVTLAAPRQYLRAGERLAAADLDGDGTLDLAVVTREPDPATASP